MQNKEKNTGRNYQKWLFNIAIVCIATVVIGFVFSAGQRLINQDKKIDLNQTDVVQKNYTPVMVEVLNGCGVSGMAGKFSNYLRKKGIDVSYTGNAESMDNKKTYLVQRVKNKDKFKILNKVLNFSKQRVQVKDTATPHTDFTLVIGKDYKELEIYQKIIKTGENLSKK